MAYFYIFVVLISGLLLPVQIGLNTMVSRALASPILAAIISFVVGLVGLIIYYLFTNPTWPSASTLASVPRYAWVAGLLGGFYVATSVIAAPRLGAALFIALIVAGQLIGSLLLDHYGLVGFPKHSLNWGRIIGAALVFGGVLIFRRF